MERTGSLPDILARTATDAEGRFHFERVTAPAFPSAEDNKYLGKTWFPWDLVVLAPGHGLSWARLTPQNQREPLTIPLPQEAAIRGRVVGTAGRPIAGVHLHVSDIAPMAAHIREFQSTEERLSLEWSSVPVEATTGADGRFVLAGLPPEKRVAIIARADGFQHQ